MLRIAYLLIGICLTWSQANAQSFSGVVAHRAGVWNDASLPENSIASLNKCASIGVNVIEIDVHLTKDSVVVVNHDHDFQGMDIATNDFRQLKNHAKLSNGESLSTLEEYIQEIQKHPDLKLWIDIKRSKVGMAWDVRAGEYVAKAILKTNSSAISEVIAPMFLTMVKIKMLAPQVKLHYIGTNYHAEALKELDFAGINLQYKRYHQEFEMSSIAAAGLKIGAYVVDDPAIMQDLLDKKVDYITTNKPQVLLDLLK